MYRGPASLLAAQVLAGTLVAAVDEQAAGRRGRPSSQGDLQSWGHAFPALLSILLEAGLGAAEVLVEYELPLTDRVADVVLAGIHPATQEPSYVMVEVKRWTQVAPGDASGLLRVPGLPRSVLNPANQVRSYCNYLASYNEALHGHADRVAGVAFLPDATQDAVKSIGAGIMADDVAFFSGDQRVEMIDFLRSRLSPAAGSQAADALLSARVLPAKTLISQAAVEVREYEQFVLLDQQREAFEQVIGAVRQAALGDRKEAILVIGGPGTGKTAIGLSLLGQLHRDGRTVLHATGSMALTTALRKVAGARTHEVKELFRYFNSFMSAEQNSIDVLICDEAHRIRATSENRFTRASLRTNRPQLEELIDVARVPVFLLDEKQTVRPGEIGTVARIKEAVRTLGVGLRVVELEGQFRAGGSNAYLRWVEALLDPELGGPVPWEPDGRTILAVPGSPEEMESLLDARRSEGASARITAGYCWPWTKKVAPGDPLPPEVQIGAWARPWNVFGDRSIDGAPPAALWATDPAGFGQVGCIYAAQGFEYDWSGVIFGPDLVWRSDHWKCDRKATADPSFRAAHSNSDIERLIRNTYRVLMTRGKIGALVYSTDPETQEMLRGLAQLENSASALNSASTYGNSWS